jgi:REP element-mobilizing transposase RayT
MPRSARLRIEGAYYHVHAKVAGKAKEYPLAGIACQRKLIDALRFYSEAYCCSVYSFCVMGNHWHCVIGFECVREIDNL